MFDKFKTAALSAVVALGTLAAIPATAQAESLYLNFGGRDAGISIGVAESGHSWRDRRDHRWHDRRDHRERRDVRARCSPERALWKAERMGIRRAQVTGVNRNTIVVRGRSHGDRVRVVFGRSPSCPIVR